MLNDSDKELMCYYLGLCGEECLPIIEISKILELRQDIICMRIVHIIRKMKIACHNGEIIYRVI